MLRGVAHELEPDGRPSRLGGRLVQRTDADVVDQRLLDGVDLPTRMGGQPDQHVRPDELADLDGGHVLLSDVHPVRPHLDRDRGAVVDDQERSQPLTQSPRRKGYSGQLAVVEVLLAQLHDLDPSRDGGAQKLRKLTPA